MRFLIRIIILATALILLPGCDKPKPLHPSGRTIKIGVVGPFSGPYAYMGKNALKGIKTIMEMTPLLNNGDTIELIIADDMNTPGITIQSLEKLTAEDKVTALLILSQSASVLEAAQVADHAQTPILATVASHPGITLKNGFISQLCFDDSFQGMVGALLIRDELLFDKAAVLSDSTNPSSKFLADHFTRKFTALGGRITMYSDLGNLGKLERNLLETIKNQDTEVLYLPLSGKKFFEVTNILKKMGWKPNILGSDGLKAALLNKNMDYSNYDGVLLTDYYNPHMPLTDFGEKAALKYRSLHDSPPNGYTVMGAEGYALLLNALNRCTDKENRTCVNQMLRNTPAFIGITGTVTLQDGKAQRPLVVNVIREGKMEFLVKVY